MSRQSTKWGWVKWRIKELDAKLNPYFLMNADILASMSKRLIRYMG